MITLNLSTDEANALAGLLDIAVKAGGIRSANAALVIFQKLEAAAKVENSETKEVQ
jgi:hypothetical protein